MCCFQVSLATIAYGDTAIRGCIWRSCWLSILLYPGSSESNSWTLSSTLPPSSLCHCLCPAGKCPHFMVKMYGTCVWVQNMRSVPFCNSFPARRGHYQTEKRYQTLRNILHSGRRLSSAPPSLPADNQSTSPAAQRPQFGTTTTGQHGAAMTPAEQQGAEWCRGCFFICFNIVWQVSKKSCYQQVTLITYLKA